MASATPPPSRESSRKVPAPDLPGLPGTRTRQSVAKRLRAITGDITTATITEIEHAHPWYSELPPESRSLITLVAQAGIDGFVEWFRDPASMSPRAGVFGNAPRELARRVSLQQTVQLVRTTTTVVENEIHRRMSRSDRQHLQVAVVRYSAEVAFAAAEVYARAAEVRGRWDDRTESLVIDAILRGEVDEDLLSRAATLGWTSGTPVVVVIGEAVELDPVPAMEALRRSARHHHIEVLAAILGDRTVAVLGSSALTDDAAGVELVLPMANGFGPGPIVVGPVVDHLLDANSSARAALAGYRAVAGWPGAPRPVSTTDLLPERALNGDGHARRQLAEQVHSTLDTAGNDLLETLTTFFEQSGSIEATARVLFVHANTVRYRLRRIEEVTGFRPMDARDAYALRMGLTLGRLRTSHTTRL